MGKKADFYRAILDSLNSSIAVIDPAGKVIFANRFLSHSAKASSEDVFSRSANELLAIPEKDPKLMKKISETVLSGGEPMEQEYWFPIIDEQRMCGLITFLPLLEKESASRYLIAHALDVTDRKLAEDALQESEERFRAIAQVAHDAIILLDKERRVTFWNKAATRIFGFSEEEMSGTRFEDSVFDHQGGLQFIQELAQIQMVSWRHGGGGMSELHAIRKGGEEFAVELSVSSFSHDEKLNIVCAFRDISARKKAEKESQEAKELAEEANRLKDKFVALVSHDLRSPLGAISTYLQLIGQNLSGKKHKQAQEMVFYAREILKGLLDMVDKLLDVSRLKSGKINPTSKEIDIYLLLHTALSPYFQTALAKGITIKNDAPRNRKIFADPEMFGEVIKNLVSNAVKFSSAGDVITLFVPDDKPSTVAVRDTGKGIDPTFMDDLFQYEVTTTSEGTCGERGSGLGLPLCRDIMRAHGGELTFTTVLDEGTTFFATVEHTD